jgi:hypothetical protein
MIPKSCRLFGPDHAVNEETHDPEKLQTSWSSWVYQEEWKRSLDLTKANALSTYQGRYQPDPARIG